MANKKHYHYDKEQFVDREGRLLFLIRTSSLDYDKTAYHLVDIFNEPHIFSNVKFAELEKVTDTYKFFVDSKCEEMDFSHRKPTGLLKENRNEVIHKCLTEAYKSIREDSKPTIDNLAEVFQITRQTLIGTENNNYKGNFKAN